MSTHPPPSGSSGLALQAQERLHNRSGGERRMLEFHPVPMPALRGKTRAALNWPEPVLEGRKAAQTDHATETQLPALAQTHCGIMP